MDNRLTYLADCILIEALAKDDMKIALAQEGGLMSSIVSNIKSYVLNAYDKDHPAASILSLMGPGILFKLGFPWLSFVMALAGILGFDWKGFWETLGHDILELINAIHSQKDSPPNEGQISSEVHNAVSNAFEKHFNGEVDQKRLEEIAKRSNSSIKECIEIKKFAINFANNPTFIKEAGAISSVKGGIAKFFIRTITWLATTAIISLPFIAAMGIGKGIVGGTSQPAQEKDTTNYADKMLKASPNTPADFYDNHRNDLSSLWIERGNIADIAYLLYDWVVAAYPQFGQYKDKLIDSAAFQNVKDAFRARNRLATGTGLISIPHPYQRKIDVVNDIANKFLVEKKLVSA